MKRTKAQLEAQLTTAQSLIVATQGVNRAQLERITELEKADRGMVVGLQQQVYQLTNQIADLERRLMRRAGKVDALQDLVLVAMGKHRGSLRED